MKLVGIMAALSLLSCIGRPALANNCQASATNVQFGSYSGATIDITGTVTAKCSGNIPTFTVAIDAGTGSGATVTSRSMTGPGGASLGYQIFRDAARTLNWGNTPSVDTVSGVDTGGPTNFVIYARLPVNEYAPAGSYIDTVLNVRVIGSDGSIGTAQFSVSASLTKACNITATNLVFGVYTRSLKNSTSTISVQCTNSTAYNVGLDAGIATGASMTNRSMTGTNAALLGYKLFRDSARTLNWGNTVGTDTVAGTGNGAVQSLTVYGQIPAGQNVAPGNYTDTITAIITY